MNHPLLQSVVLPGALALLFAWALSRWPLAALRPATGAVLAVVIAAGWLVGWSWPPGSLAGWLPWVALAAGALGAALDLGRGQGAATRSAFVTAGVLGVGAFAAWFALGLPPAPALITEALLIAAIACLLPWSARARLDGLLAASIACGGLAVLMALSGSLLLAQLAALLASALGGLLLAAGWRAQPALGHAFALLAGWGFLALALAGIRLTSTTALQVALLALAWVPAALWPLGRAGASAASRSATGGAALSPSWPRTLVTCVVTALIVAAVLAAVHTGLLSTTPSTGPDDDYYAPSWD